jgi:Fe-S-cluster containining protein
VNATWSACNRFAATLDCLDCGACCREAFTTVEVSARDPFVKSHPELIVRQESGRRAIRRDGGPEPATGPRCAALVGDGPYTCVAYADRPWTCRGFTAGSPACADARRRVGR